MPLYEYACAACRGRFTALLSSWSSQDPSCPACGAGEVRRLTSTFASPRAETAGGDFGERPDDGSDEDYGGTGDSEGDFDDY